MTATPAVLPDILTLDPQRVPRAVLQRLRAEVQAEVPAGPQASDRIHHRHNRGPGRPRPPSPPPDPEEKPHE